MTKIKSIPCCPECGNTKRNQLKTFWPKDEPPQLQCTKCGRTDHVGQIKIWFKRIEVDAVDSILEVVRTKGDDAFDY